LPNLFSGAQEFLRALLEQRGLAQADIADLLGGSGYTSGAIKKLAPFFGLRAGLFV
jgi:hypothetical protein